RDQIGLTTGGSLELEGTSTIDGGSDPVGCQLEQFQVVDGQWSFRTRPHVEDTDHLTTGPQGNAGFRDDGVGESGRDNFMSGDVFDHTRVPRGGDGAGQTPAEWDFGQVITRRTMMPSDDQGSAIFVQ